jgi:acetylornithine deacetylase/succinyl-diaminopimelate desuccinylase-like protein
MSGAPKPMTVPGLTDSSGIDDIVGTIGILTEQPTPRGSERATATALASWAGHRWPGLQFAVDEIGRGGANLVCSVGEPSTDDLLFYSHLDTSLTGIGARDQPVTGRAHDSRSGFTVHGDEISAFGLAVARGPAAAALTGFVAAATSTDRWDQAPLRLVLAGGGTHENTLRESDSGGAAYCGIESYLDRYPLPAAALIAKAGPRGVLWDEPGAGYLRIRVGGRRGAVLARDAADPPGGLPTHIGTVCAAVETWRNRWRTTPHPAGNPTDSRPALLGRQAGREAGIGAIRAGSTRKPDLLPAFIDLYVYLVMLPGEPLADIAADLGTHLRTTFAGGPLSECTVNIQAAAPQDAGTTSPLEPFVRSAIEVWERHHDASAPELSGWTGSTDGALLRAAAVHTIRTGPANVTINDEPEWDSLSLTELLRFARIYADIGAGWTARRKRGN